LFERLRSYKVFFHVLPLIPSGSLRRSKALNLDNLIPKSKRAVEFIAITALDAITKVYKLAGYLTAGAKPPSLRQFLKTLLQTVALIGVRKLSKSLGII
jgi:hypothetical protein